MSHPTHAQRRLTRREQQIAHVTQEVVRAEIAATRPKRSVYIPTPTEALFAEAAGEKGFSSITRNGWPDFLVRNPAGKLVAVEVKGGGDRLSSNQRIMFALLETTGLPIFVWWSEKPKILIPWRNFVTEGTPFLRARLKQLTEALRVDKLLWGE